MDNSNVQLGSLYDMNKQIMTQQPIATDKERAEYATKIIKWFENKTYSMLLCHDRYDYTVFEEKTKIHSDKVAVSALFECIDNRGKLQSMDFLEDGAVEIWIKIDGESYCYYLFDYAEAIITY